MEEVWKDIKSYEGIYMVSNFGRIKSLTRIIEYENGRHRPFEGCLMNGGKTPTGYCFVALRKNNKNKYQQYIHRLVAIAFIPNPENKKTVNHIDGDKSNNYVNNLEWNTCSENTLHAFKTGLMKKGQECSFSKLTEKHVLEIRENKSKLMQKDLAVIYSVSPHNIGRIINRKTWKHLD